MKVRADIEVDVVEVEAVELDVGEVVQIEVEWKLS